VIWQLPAEKETFKFSLKDVVEHMKKSQCFWLTTNLLNVTVRTR